MPSKIELRLKPTKEEEVLLDKYFWMLDAHFNVFKQEFIFIDKNAMIFDQPRNHCIYSTTYGMKAVAPPIGQRPFASFFVRMYHRVYQCESLVEVGKLLLLLSKEASYDHYMDLRSDKLSKLKKKKKKANRVKARKV